MIIFCIHSQILDFSKLFRLTFMKLKGADSGPVRFNFFCFVDSIVNYSDGHFSSLAVFETPEIKISNIRFYFDRIINLFF